MNDTPLAKYTERELLEELEKRRMAERIKVFKSTVVNGFTHKDVVCMYGSAYEGEDYYSFYLRVDGKLYDIYYKDCATDGFSSHEPNRWPSDEYDDNAAAIFVPYGFDEDCENAYSYHGPGTPEECLKQNGIEFRVWAPEKVVVNDNGDEHDKNYD